MLEAAWGDVLAVLTVGLLLGMRSQGGAVAQGLAHGLFNQVGIALLFTIPGGFCGRGCCACFPSSASGKC